MNKNDIRKQLSKIKIKIRRNTKLHKWLYPLKKFLPSDIKSWVEKKSNKSLVDVDELRPQYKKACAYLLDNMEFNKIGDYLEFGVCHGTSLACMDNVLKEFKLDKVRLIGFDSFEGLPDNKLDKDGFWRAGQFKSEIDATKNYLNNNGINWSKTFLIKGWFSETLTEELKEKLDIRKASLIMIDCDMYSSTKEALNFCNNLIIDTAIIFFDDWNSQNLAEKNLGEKRAFDEFLNENPQFKTEEFGNYSYKLKPRGKVFIINRID